MRFIKNSIFSGSLIYECHKNAFHTYMDIYLYVSKDQDWKILKINVNNGSIEQTKQNQGIRNKLSTNRNSQITTYSYHPEACDISE